MIHSGLTKLTLRNFRCFESFSWKPQPGLNFILGPNAQGKTSLLEAACFLLRLKSPRTHKVNDLLRFGKSSFALAGKYAEEYLSLQITPEKTRPRELSINDVLQHSTSHYLEKGSIVWFGNDDREIITGSSERRRRFLDSAGLQVGTLYRRTLRFYERALRSRNSLLKEGRPRREIEAYNIPLIESGDELTKMREEIVAKIAPLAKKAGHAISGETISLTYHPGAHDSMKQSLLASQVEEQRLRTTCIGPHRDNFFINLNDIPATEFASEGQQRTIALALKIALASFLNQERGKEASPPLLLLDDIFGELDEDRRNALLLTIPKNSQALVTTTELRNIDIPEKSTVFHLLDHFQKIKGL